ncbi:MAG: hypothetical protein IJ875_05555, partial [Solobacterium sp.]|nr:hypothetical protein [Solobacterium sp.]
MSNLFQNIETITFSKSANQFLYFLSHAPIFKRFFHADLVGEYEAKSGISLALRSIGYLYAFLKKVFYLSLIVSFMELMEDRATFGHIFFFLTIAGACVKRIFNFSEEKHYLFLRLYRMPAMRYVKYTLHHYLFFETLYFGIALLFVSKFTSIPYWHMLIYLAMYLSLHLIGEAIYFFFIMRNECKITNENRILFTTFGLGLFFFLCAMQVFFTKLYIGEMGMLIISMIVSLLGIYAYDYLLHKPNYHRIFKYNLSLDAIAEANTFAGGGTYAFISLMEMQENLDDSAIQGDKKGYEYIHAAFQNRYRKSLYRGQIWYMLIEIVIGLALLIIPFFFPDFDRSTIAEFTTKDLAAVLYLI